MNTHIGVKVKCCFPVRIIDLSCPPVVATKTTSSFAGSVGLVFSVARWWAPGCSDQLLALVVHVRGLAFELAASPWRWGTARAAGGKVTIAEVKVRRHVREHLLEEGREGARTGMPKQCGLRLCRRSAADDDGSDRGGQHADWRYALRSRTLSSLVSCYLDDRFVGSASVAGNGVGRLGQRAHGADDGLEPPVPQSLGQVGKPCVVGFDDEEARALPWAAP